MGLKEILTSHGFRFDKRYGQNFISETNLLSSIVTLAGVGEGDVAVEIGVGAGTLTGVLSERCAKVVGYEIDKRLQPILAETLKGAANVQLVFKDFMRESMSEVERLAGGRYAVVANLPYYVTTPVIMRFIEEAKNCFRIVVMVQEEVAERLCAEADTPEYGAITAAVAAVGNARIVKRVPRTAFYPVPNVDSAVVRIDIVGNKYGIADMGVYRQTVRAAFASRRKTLANNLMQSFALKRSDAEELLERANIDKMARGETLSAERLAVLANEISGR